MSALLLRKLPFLHRWRYGTWGRTPFRVRRCAWCQRIEVYTWGTWGPRSIDADHPIALEADWTRDALDVLAEFEARKP